MNNFMFYYWGIFFTLAGLLIGSFLNVCIYRIPKGETVVTVPSHCTNCGHKLSWYDLFPVFSYIFLRGKCRYCKANISPRYAFVELLNSIIWAFDYFYFGGLTYQTILCSLMFSALIVVTFTDIDVQEVPDRIHIFIGILGIILIFFDLSNWLSHIIGFFAISIPVLIIAVITNGFGGGDIKLYAVLGLFMGWQNIILLFAFSVVLGGIFGVIFMIAKKANRKTHMSFVPYIAVAAFIVQIAGNDIINWYITNFFPAM